MNDRRGELAQRRVQLQQRAAAQRQQLGVVMDSIDTRIRTVDQGILKVTGFMQKPLVLAVGAALALFIGPRRMLRLAGKIALGLSIARRLLRI